MLSSYSKGRYKDVGLDVMNGPDALAPRAPFHIERRLSSCHLLDGKRSFLENYYTSNIHKMRLRYRSHRQQLNKPTLNILDNMPLHTNQS
jgi:hypothetical protein